MNSYIMWDQAGRSFMCDWDAVPAWHAALHSCDRSEAPHCIRVPGPAGGHPRHDRSMRVGHKAYNSHRKLLGALEGGVGFGIEAEYWSEVWLNGRLLGGVAA